MNEVLHHPLAMSVGQAVTGRSMYLHTDTVEVRKNLLIRGVLKSGHLSAWKMHSHGLVLR
jgi:hypothetical protein